MSQSQGRLGITTYRRNLAHEAAGRQQLSQRLDALEARVAELARQGEPLAASVPAGTEAGMGEKE